MRRRLDRIRFRSTARREDESGDHEDSPNLSDGESVSEDGTSELAGPITFGSIRESEELRDPACVGTPTLLGPVPDSLRTESDKLNEVKGHLELALLEKHFLQEELRRLREEPGLEQIRQELERERCRCRELEANLEATSHSSRNEDKALCGERRDVLDGYKEEACCSWVTRIRTVGLAWLGELYQLLQPLTETKRDDTEEPLSARRLTENMRRVKRAAKPLTNFLRDLTALSHWYSFYTSALAFLVFGYAVWHGWALSLLLFLGIVRLSLNYLIARGWRIRWSIVPEVTEAEEPMKMDLTMSEKFQLVLDVAQKAQNLFGKLADILEKLKNLLMWIEEDATQTLYLMFWAAFLASCFLPAPLLGRIMGLIIAFRFFVVAPVFNRFPRVHLRYDTAHRLWNLLPTNQQLRERPPGLNSSRRNMGPMARSGSSPVLGGSDRGDDAIGSVPLSRKASFHETFSLPETEKPLPACENGWRCCLINRDKKISTDYIRNGLLYVTDNFICFESKSGPSKKNKVIPLQGITEIQKYKVLTMLPGSGMGISIKTPSTQKPLVFGAMVHRDEAYQTIMSRFSSLAQQPVQATLEAANLNITACS